MSTVIDSGPIMGPVPVGSPALEAGPPVGSGAPPAAAPLPATVLRPHANGAADSAGASQRSRSLHRLAAARHQEGVSRRTIARRLGVSVKEVQEMERPQFDMLLSTLCRWQEVLNVPIAELLEESDVGLSRPVQLRAKLLKTMKTAMTILERAKQQSVRRLAQDLVGQLVETMPELKSVTSWPSVGKRRRTNELGAAARRCFSGGLLGDVE